MRDAASKIAASWDEAASRREQLRGKVVFTNGVFDLLHPGHVDVLAAARSRGDALIVGLNTDDSVKRLKGAGRPVRTQAERAYVLAALEAVPNLTCELLEYEGGRGPMLQHVGPLVAPVAHQQLWPKLAAWAEQAP